MSDGRTLISVVVPTLNEELNIDAMYEALLPVMQSLEERYCFEVIITDNHSVDSTFDKARALARRDPRVRAYRFSRNFGYQKSLHTGYSLCRGAAAVQLDCDLQDPPELIPRFLDKWEEGYAVVYGVRRTRIESRWTEFQRRIYYRLLNWISEYPIPPDAGDFRLIDRRLIDQLRSMNPEGIYIRGAIAEMGFDQTGVEYDRGARQRGESKFPLGKMISLAVDGILNHSTIPLRLAAYFGFLLSAITLLAALAYGAVRLFVRPDWPAGWTTLVFFVLLSLGINSMFLGVLGEYLGRLYRQTSSVRHPLIEDRTESEPPALAG